MAEEIDVDGAFDRLTARESETVPKLVDQSKEMMRLLMAVSAENPAFFMNFHQVLQAREKFMKTAMEWVKYAVDESVLDMLMGEITRMLSTVEQFAGHVGAAMQQTYKVKEKDDFQADLDSMKVSFDDFQVRDAMMLGAVQLPAHRFDVASAWLFARAAMIKCALSLLMM